MQKISAQKQTRTENSREELVESPEGTVVAIPSLDHTSQETERSMDQMIENEKSYCHESLPTPHLHKQISQTSSPVTPAFDSPPLKRCHAESSISSVSFIAISY